VSVDRQATDQDVLNACVGKSSQEFGWVERRRHARRGASPPASSNATRYESVCLFEVLTQSPCAIPAQRFQCVQIVHIARFRGRIGRAGRSGCCHGVATPV
jgi:hypothetical protein